MNLVAEGLGGVGVVQEEGAGLLEVVLGDF